MVLQPASTHVLVFKIHVRYPLAHTMASQDVIYTRQHTHFSVLNPLAHTEYWITSPVARQRTLSVSIPLILQPRISEQRAESSLQHTYLAGLLRNGLPGHIVIVPAWYCLAVTMPLKERMLAILPAHV